MTTGVMPAFAGPTVADDGIGERLEDRAERVENFYDSFYGTDVDIDDGELEIDRD